MQLARLRRLQFGRSSEKLDATIAQLELLLEELEEARGASGARRIRQPIAAPRRGKPVRRPLPEHLPREEIVHGPLRRAAAARAAAARCAASART